MFTIKTNDTVLGSLDADALVQTLDRIETLTDSLDKTVNPALVHIEWDSSVRVLSGSVPFRHFVEVVVEGEYKDQDRPTGVMLVVYPNTRMVLRRDTGKEVQIEFLGQGKLTVGETLFDAVREKKKDRP